jgi:hypothetical protein
MFRLLATLSVNASHKLKWRALADLETQTKQRYLDYVTDKQDLVRPAPSPLLGWVYGILFGLLPWKIAMRLLDNATDDFLEVFNRLYSHASKEDLEFFQYVVAHEQAIKAFATLELEGEASLSLQPVLDLLP